MGDEKLVDRQAAHQKNKAETKTKIGTHRPVLLPAYICRFQETRDERGGAGLLVWFVFLLYEVAGCSDELADRHALVYMLSKPEIINLTISIIERNAKANIRFIDLIRERESRRFDSIPFHSIPSIPFGSRRDETRQGARPT